MERGRAEILPRIGKVVAGWIRSISRSGDSPSQEAVLEAEFPDASSELVKQTEILLATSLLLGMDHAEEGMELADPDPEYHPLPFQEAIQFLKARVSLPKAEWEQLEPKLAFRAFTLAKLTQCDYIEAVRGRLVAALQKGEGFERAWEDVRAIADSEGSILSPGYWETVYRTNVQTAYNAGRRMQFDRSKPKAYALMVLEDERTSDICKPLVGLVLPAEHPFWQNHWPPFHFNCRTTVRGIYEELEEVPVQNIPLKQLQKEFRPQKGFGENPLSTDSFWMFTPSMLQRAERYGIGEEFYNFYMKLFPPTGKPEPEITFSSVAYAPLREKLVQSFQGAPESVRRKIVPIQNRVAVVPSVKYEDGRVVCFYSYHKNAVFLESGAGAGTIRHEYGHAYDWGTVEMSKWEDFGRALDQDRSRYISPSGVLTRRGESILQKDEWKVEPALSDTFAALTKNRIYGEHYHKTAYWELGAEYQNAELVANAFDVWGSGQKELLRQYRALFPALAGLFDKLFGAVYTK